ncbi:hypothetical protein Tco_0316018 [Tanacetum coccineum]
MDTTRAQQQALDDELFALADQIYMQEFWVTVFRHLSLLRFKLNDKSHTVNVDNFRDMLKICPKLHGQIFEEPPLEEEIISFIRDLGHTEEIKFISDVNGVYHNKTVDYVYLLWEDLVYQVENKNSKKNNDMYYPRFTKVIVDYFMAKDQGIPRRNKMFWHYARDEFIFTTIRVISKHQDTQVYGAILPQHLTNQAMLESEAYMTYRAYVTGEKTPKPKTTKRKLILNHLPRQSLLKLLKMKISIERSKIQTHSSHASGSGDGVDIQSKVPDEQQQNISGTNEGAGEDDEDNDVHVSENDNDDEDDDQENVSGETESDNDKDDFVHPNLSTYKADDQEEEKEEEKANDDDDVSSDQMVSTPPDYEITKEEENQEDDDNVMGGEQEDEEDEELYEDLNLNLERRDAEMTDAQVN